MKKTFLSATGLLLLLVALMVLPAFRDDKPAYRVFNDRGKSAGYDDLLKSAREADIIFFGELHRNPIVHWLEYELTRDLYDSKGKDLVLGMEMFETDNQLLLNEYLSKMIRKKDFESEAKIWPNYKTDYAPIVDFAREKGVRVVATNIPRRFAAIVNSKGFEGLDSINAIQRGMIAPLPIKYPDTLACYAGIAKSIGDNMPAHQTTNLGKAQAIKDATMAHFIAKGGAFEGKTILHFNGSFHTDNREGLVWYMQQAIRKTRFDLKILTITCVEQDDIQSITDSVARRADYIIAIPSSMTGSENR